MFLNKEYLIINEILPWYFWPKKNFIEKIKMKIACFLLSIFAVYVSSSECPDKNCMNGGVFLNCNCQCKNLKIKKIISKDFYEFC